jgi:hypothetical protein
MQQEMKRIIASLIFKSNKIIQKLCFAHAMTADSMTNSKTTYHFFLFTFFLWVLVLAIVTTGINSVFFSTWYLPFVYKKHYNMFDLVNFDMIISYATWSIGKYMIVLNILLFVIAFILWELLVHSDSQK